MTTKTDLQETIETYLTGIKDSAQQFSKIKEAGKSFIVEGYMTVFNVVDSQGDVFTDSAFDRFIDEFKEKVKVNPRWLPVLFRHRWDYPLGYVKSMVKDEYGVYVVLDIDKAGDKIEYAKELVRSGKMRGISHYFYNGLGRFREGIRYIHQADVLEVTLTPAPANELALIQSFSKSKELYKNWKAVLIELLQIECGLSRKEARSLFSSGLKGLDIEDEKISLMNEIINGMC